MTEEATNEVAQEAPAPDPAAELEALRAKYERAQKDLQKFRTRADEVEASKKALEDEALKQKTLEEQIEALNKRAQEAEERATAAEQARVTAQRTASLTGKVADPKAALKLLEEGHLTDEGDVNVPALLEAYPFLAPAQAGRPSVPSANATRVGEDGPLAADAFRGKPEGWIAENLHRLRPKNA
jgi:predicted nuclease with TOPRIM domain